MTPPSGVAVVTLFSAARLDHARNQFESLHGSGVEQVAVWLDATTPPVIDGVTVLHCAPGPAGLRLAAGRNAGASAAIAGVGTQNGASGCSTLIFLDADCLAGAELVTRYAEAAAEHPLAVLCGPVTYLPSDSTARTARELALVTAPHAARPNLPAGETRQATAEERPLFWSLSFALTSEAWQQIGGFSEEYEGYGAEDTDFAERFAAAGVDMLWLGGAHAYHQYHPTSTPPWQHLDDILRNATIFQRRWGWWPMEGWLSAFADAGAIAMVDGVWTRTA